MYNLRLFSSLLLFFSLVFCSIFSSETSFGTLIVTYQTGSLGENLDRVRFLITNEQKEQQIYPQESASREDRSNSNHTALLFYSWHNSPHTDKETVIVDPNSNQINLFSNHQKLRSKDLNGPWRKVVIKNLPVGKYSLKFLIPTTDGSLDGHSENEVIINPNKVTEVNQLINLQPITTAIEKSEAPAKEGLAINPEINPPLIIYNQPSASLTVNINLPTAHWTLFRDDIIVFIGIGPISNFQLQTGSNYRIEADEIEGYSLKIIPSFAFNVSSGEHVTAEISYVRTYGYLDIKTNFVDPEGFEITIQPKGMPFPPIQVPLIPKEQKINWKSAPLPTGMYEVTYKFPSSYEPLASETIRIKKGEHTILRPRPVVAGIVRVTANTPDARYFLRKSDNSQALQGEGKEFIFKGLTPGTYTLTFSSPDPSLSIPPSDMRVTINNFENKSLKAVYRFAGQVNIQTNVDKSTVIIRNLSSFSRDVKEEIIGRQRTLTLPEGRYRLSFEAPSTKEIKFQSPSSVELIIRPSHTEEVNAIFTSIGSPSPKQPAKPTPSSKASPESPRGHPETVFIPGGKAIIGDSSPDQTNELPAKTVHISPFFIGIYEVTNAQFALWLTQAYKDKKIVYVSEADKQGQILDLEGHLLFKTFEADPYSQISVRIDSPEETLFLPMFGKDAYPVINVSWYGAIAYCKDNQCRLPTEAEWEKAAGMAPEEPGKPLTKFRFGFGKDTIDKTWANYKDNTQRIQFFKVLTTPVGFYNGINLLPLSIESKGQQKTNLAKSPYGAFDMSGNVWEWVWDWYDSEYSANMNPDDPKGPSQGTQKVAKGGCYDSLADGVRVAERLPLSPEHTDAFTGFRIAVDAF